MSKLPLFGTFEQTVTNGVAEIRQAWTTKKRHFLIFYLILILVLLGLFILGAIATVDAGLSAWHRIFPAPIQSTQPAKTLSYSIATTTKDKDGLYHTDFDLAIHVPAGNNQETMTLYNNFPLKDSSCTINSSPLQQSEFRGGLASTTYTYHASCVSREKIIDTGTLFQVVP